MNPAEIAALHPEQKALVLARLQSAEALRRVKDQPRYEWQIAPKEKFGAHEAWLLCGGRGVGKSFQLASAIVEHVNGPACDETIPGGHRISIIGPTLGDVMESVIGGPSGLKMMAPGLHVGTAAGGTHATFPNGAEAKLFGCNTANDVERLRSGGNRCFLAFEELAAWRYIEEAMAHARLGLRIGPNPYIVAASTPKPRAAFIEFYNDPRTFVTSGRTMDATFLAQDVRDELFAMYGNTRLGRQELDGILLTEIAGALVTMAMIDAARVDEAPELDTVIIAIDPAVTSTEESDETGIVVAGATGGHGYVLADHSGRHDAAGPRGWPRLVARLAQEYGADWVIAESNQGGDLVEAAIRAEDPRLPVRQIKATKGKAVRAQPIAAKIEQGKWHHVGMLDTLEAQWSTYVPGEGSSPDRMDASVWAGWWLLHRDRLGEVSAGLAGRSKSPALTTSRIAGARKPSGGTASLAGRRI